MHNIIFDTGHSEEHWASFNNIPKMQYCTMQVVRNQLILYCSTNSHIITTSEYHSAAEDKLHELPGQAQGVLLC